MYWKAIKKYIFFLLNDCQIVKISLWFILFAARSVELQKGMDD